VGTFTLLADEAEELDGTGTGGPKPVRGAGVELGDLSWFEDDAVFAEDQAEAAVEDVDPVVALVGPKGGSRVSLPVGRTNLYDWMFPGRRVRRMMVDPSPHSMGRRLMRGFPVGGASTSSSRVTP